MDFTNAHFNLQVFDYMISQYQGKYAFISILAALNSSHLNSGEQIFVKNDLLKFDKFRKEILTNQKIFFDKGKCNPDNSEYRALKSSLEQMSMDLLNHSEKVTPIIDSTDYSSDHEKVNLLAASYGRICYQRTHLYTFNLDSAVALNLQQDAANFQQLKNIATKNMTELDSFIQNTLLSKQLIPREVYISFWETAVTVPALLKAASHDIDMLVTLCEKENFEYQDYPYMSKNEIEDWKLLNVTPEAIGYWKACDFSPSKAAPWINANINDPLTCYTCLKYKISLNDASLSIENNIPLVLTRRWLALGVSIQEGIERMKQGEMPQLIDASERML